MDQPRTRSILLGQYSEAVASYDRAFSIDPNDAKVWITVDTHLGELGQNSEAVDSYDKAIAVDPNDQMLGTIAESRYI